MFIVCLCLVCFSYFLPHHSPFLTDLVNEREETVIDGEHEGMAEAEAEAAAATVAAE